MKLLLGVAERGIKLPICFFSFFVCISFQMIYRYLVPWCKNISFFYLLLKRKSHHGSLSHQFVTPFHHFVAHNRKEKAPVAMVDICMRYLSNKIPL